MPTTRRATPVAGNILTAAAGAQAAQYPARAATGWVYACKRECCNAAIAMDYGATACVNTGGVPMPPMGGGQRGSCTSHWMQDTDGSILHRCYGEVAAWCR